MQVLTLKWADESEHKKVLDTMVLHFWSLFDNRLLETDKT